ncbi:hypothetical protein BLNAU_14722 [Blattamonas nauphoetae]|uniref:Uncharacterized protein n=1 Tax=Blattamonas nauphoetae TaxID=2049346 RepID=A0ABQ9XEC6_9EUKA|nr:hypothetical protein BLNAU_14722 [Blattamonas nauphoetae]
MTKRTVPGYISRSRISFRNRGSVTSPHSEETKRMVEHIAVCKYQTHQGVTPQVLEGLDGRVQETRPVDHVR